MTCAIDAWTAQALLAPRVLLSRPRFLRLLDGPQLIGQVLDTCQFTPTLMRISWQDRGQVGQRRSGGRASRGRFR